LIYLGKSSVVKRYVDNEFRANYLFTIGVDFALKVLNWSPTEIVKLQLWDIAGQERFGSMTRVYYKEAVGAIIVFDITNKRSFQAVTKWKNDLDKKVRLQNDDPVPALLIANKCDLNSRAVTVPEIQGLCQELGFFAWFETSAKENVNIEIAMNQLVKKIFEGGSVQTNPNVKSGEMIDLSKQPQEPPPSNDGCC